MRDTLAASRSVRAPCCASGVAGKASPLSEAYEVLGERPTPAFGNSPAHALPGSRGGSRYW